MIREENIMTLNYKFVVSDPLGLHAKSLTVLVNEASKFDSNIKLIYEGKEASLKSIMGVMALGVPSKAKLEIVAEGQDEPEVIENLKEVIKNLKIAE